MARGESRTVRSTSQRLTASTPNFMAKPIEAIWKGLFSPKPQCISLPACQSKRTARQTPRSAVAMENASATQRTWRAPGSSAHTTEPISGTARRSHSAFTSFIASSLEEDNGQDDHNAEEHRDRVALQVAALREDLEKESADLRDESDQPDDRVDHVAVNREEEAAD